MATFDLGRVTPIYKGDYNAATSYELNDVVLYNGSLYWHVRATATVGILPTDTTVWKLAFADDGIRAEIRGYADDAQASADSALASKSAAATSETNAAASAQTATTKASEAAASATSAQESVTDAQSEADRAKTYADMAAEVELEIPTKVSQLENDAGYLTEHQPLDEYVRKDVLYNMLPVDTASGAVASFPDGADDIPVKSLVVGIEPVQAGTGDPSPDNVRPITGWTGVNVKRMGVNLWDEEWESGTLDISTGKKVSSSVTMRSKNFIPVKPGMKYIAVGPHNVVNTNQFIICYYDKDEVYVGYRTLTRPEPFEVPSDWRIALMRFAYRYYLNDSGNVYNHDVSVNYPSTATGYEPYNSESESVDISFPTEAGTVYGGTLDVTNGVLTVTKGYIQSYNGETLPSTWISDRDVYAQGATPTTGAEVCYDLSTPVTYNLTPTEVKSLLGQNNIWADTGDTTVKYRADTSAYIAKKIAEAISALS